MSDDVRDPKLAAVEAALRGLAPAPARVNRDRILFTAGARSVRRGLLWPVATAVSLVLVGVLGVAHVLRPAVREVERVVHVPVPLERVPHPPMPPEHPPEPAPESPSHTRPESLARAPAPEGYLRLRNQVVRFGVDALPSTPAVPQTASPQAPTRARELPDPEPWFGGWRPSFLPFRPGDRS
jgi:hypothetical protein